PGIVENRPAVINVAIGLDVEQPASQIAEQPAENYEVALAGPGYGPGVIQLAIEELVRITGGVDHGLTGHVESPIHMAPTPVHGGPCGHRQIALNGSAGIQCAADRMVTPQRDRWSQG